MHKIIPKNTIKNSNIITINDIDNETILLENGKLVAQAKTVLPKATNEEIGAGRIATPTEVLNKQSDINTETPAFVSVDDLKVLFGADFDEAGYKCIVSSDSTEIAEYIVKDSNLPNIGLVGKTRYVLQNPFGNNTPVITETEVFHNGKWGSTGMYYYSADLIGAKSNYFEGVGIVVQTGSTNNQILGNSPASGNPFNIAAGPTGALKARVHVYKVGSKNTAKEYSDYKVIYSSADLTDRGAESVKSNKLPANIIFNTRYVLDNPFGVNEPCICQVELWNAAQSEWATPGYCTEGNVSFITTASEKTGEGIVVQAGLNALVTWANISGSSSSVPQWQTKTAPARIKCWKTGYNGSIATSDKKGVVQLATPDEIFNKQSTTEVPKVLTVESLAKITTIGNQGSSGYKCIYSKDYTGELGVNDIKDNNLPLNINTKSKYIIKNPFGMSTSVTCQPEIFDNGKWKTPGRYIDSPNGRYGISCIFNESLGLYLAVGANFTVINTGTNGSKYWGGGESDEFTASTTQYPCRVHVYKVGESDIPVFSGPLPETYLFGYLYSTEYSSIMKWDATLGFYRSDRLIDIGESIHQSDKLSKGKYALDGRSFIIDSKQGKVLNSLDEDTKLRWNITISNNMIYLPSVLKDKVTMFFDLGI